MTSFMRALLIGHTLPGIQVVDVIRSIDFLARRPQVDPTRIEIAAAGNAAGLRDARLEPVGKTPGPPLPDLAAFRAYAQRQYLQSPLSKSWPPGMIDRDGGSGSKLRNTSTCTS